MRTRHAIAMATCLALLPVFAQADPDLAKPFQEAEIVILGEIHDTPVHHANQAAIVRELQPDALVFEMIDPARALAVTPEIRSDPERLEAALAWERSGWPDFAMYHPIFEAAPDAAVFGAAVPQAKVQQALSEGAAAVFGDAAVLFQLDQSLDDSQYQSRIQLQDDAHCGALPEDMLPGMVEAQRLRDAQLAEATVAALADAMAQSDAPQVVVIAGNGHAREDWGVPALLSFYYADDPRVQVRTFAQYEVSSPETAPYTSWLATEPADRNDPCEVFRK